MLYWIKGMIVNVISLTLVLFFMLPGATLAGNGCFCLEDSNDNFRHSCYTQQQGIRQVVHCLDDAGEPYRLDDLNSWTRLTEGQGRCHPCQPLRTSIEGPIRGDEGDKSTTNTADEPN